MCRACTAGITAIVLVMLLTMYLTIPQPVSASSLIWTAGVGACPGVSSAYCVNINNNGQGNYTYPTVLTTIDPISGGPILQASAQVSAPPNSGSASGTSFGRVGFGDIQSTVTASASWSDALIYNSAAGSGTSSAYHGEWVDKLTIVGSAGTPVDLLFTLNFFSSTACAGGHVSVQGLASLQVDANVLDLRNNTCNTTLTQTQTYLVHTSVGSMIGLMGQLVFGAGADAFNFDSPASASVDPDSSTYISVLTPGASFISESGATYAAPTGVPEPPSLILLGSGLAGFAGVLRRRLIKG